MTRILLVAAMALPLVAARCGGDPPTLDCEDGYIVNIPDLRVERERLETTHLHMIGEFDLTPTQAGGLDAIWPGSVECVVIEMEAPRDE